MRLSLPAAILLASAIIALGLYFGLRTPAGVAPPTEAPSPTAAPQPVTSPPSPLPPSPPAPTAAQTAAHVTDLIVRAHPSWKAACWDTADPATRKAGRYTASLAFDATGTLVIFGINEVREASDPAIAQCLRQQHRPLTIPALGRSVTYEVPFQMP